MDHAKKFASAFQGLSSAYLTMVAKGKNDAGKTEGEYQVKRDAITETHYAAHLDGVSSLGIFLLNEKSMVKFGCIDIDQYPLEHKKIVDFFAEKKLPLIVDRSKSGGAHCYLFSNEWMPASKMREALRKIAAGMGHKDICEFLISKGADVNYKDASGFNSLHYTAMLGRPEVAELLIANGADVNSGDQNNFRSLHWALSKGHFDVAEVLIRKGADIEASADKDLRPIHFVSMKDKTKAVEYLISKKADLEAKDANGLTALHWAAYHGHENTARILIQKGAEVNARTYRGSTPLKFAIETGNHNVAEILRTYGGVE